MSDLQLIVLAVVAMTALAAARVVRVGSGRTPLPEGRAWLLLMVAVVVVPPLVLGPLSEPASGLLGGLSLVPFYAVILALLAFLMSLVAQGVAFVARGHLGRLGRFILLALVGDEGDPDALPFDPPLTALLAQGVALVDRANCAFPRGPEFPAQIDRAGFRSAWDALDAATATLEDRIARENRLGLGVASAASGAAKDARGRLDTLRRMAADHGQAWALSEAVGPSPHALVAHG
jgi:hypothetical protein